MHVSWAARIRAFLDGGENAPAAAAGDHTKCDLGRWIRGEGRAYAGAAFFAELEKEHEALHRIAAGVLEVKTRGDADRAEADYRRLVEQSGRVVRLLKGRKGLKGAAGQAEKKIDAL